MALLDEALGLATDKSNGALGPREGPSNGGIAVLNTQSWAHGGLVMLTASESQKGNKVVDDEGNAVPSQRFVYRRTGVLASDVPALARAIIVWWKRCRAGAMPARWKATRWTTVACVSR